MASDRTWADIENWITFELAREKGATDAAAKLRWKLMADEMVRTMLRSVPLRHLTLDSDDMTLSNGVISLPQHTVNVQSMYWGGVAIKGRTSREALDRMCPEWRTSGSSTAVGQWFVEDKKIYSYPPLSSLANVEVAIEATIPSFYAPPWSAASNYTAGTRVENDGLYYTCILNHTSSTPFEPGTTALWTTYWSAAENPLDWMPQGCELLPAYYVGARLPADAEHAAEMARQQRNAAQVALLIPICQESVLDLEAQDLRF